MKTILLSSFVLLATVFNSFGQLPIEETVDEFTKVKKVSTKWENFTMKMLISGYQRLVLKDDARYLNFKCMVNGGTVESIDKDDKFMFILKNDSVITLYSAYSEVACKGCGAIGFAGSTGYGLNLMFRISDEDYEVFKNYEVKKFRLYLNDGFVESEMNEKHAVIFRKAFNALDMYLTPKQEETLTR